MEMTTVIAILAAILCGLGVEALLNPKDTALPRVVIIQEVPKQSSGEWVLWLLAIFGFGAAWIIFFK